MTSRRKIIRTLAELDDNPPQINEAGHFIIGKCAHCGGITKRYFLSIFDFAHFRCAVRLIEEMDAATRHPETTALTARLVRSTEQESALG